MKKLLIMLALAGATPFLSAQQQPHCGSDEFEAELFKEDPAAMLNAQAARQSLLNAAQTNGIKKNTTATVYKIPVVVHVIYNSYEDNISKAQILDALAVLNEDFRRLNADTGSTRPLFKGVAADIEVEFELAKLDPNFNCTDGITRTYSPLSVNARNNVKPLVHWDNGKYLNIWVVNSIQSSGAGTTLGYAYKPRYNQDYRTDGVVIRHDMMGRIGTATGIGRTLTHEVGHYLGLDHPFYDNPQNANDDGCITGDGIADTPPVSSASFGCNLNRNSCHNDSPDLPDMIENYMDYADDVCTNLFTQGQKAVMRASLETAGLRKNLAASSNHDNTGLTNLSKCAPLADFTSSEQTLCPGTTVQFTDLTAEGRADTYSWSFPGGQPSSSSAENPTVTYPYPGVYPVSLTASNSAGTVTETKASFIVVKDAWNVNEALWQESFESGMLDENQVNVVTTHDNREFEVVSNAGSHGSHSLKLENSAVNLAGEVDEFISPLIYTRYGYGMNLYFDYAFARKSNSDQDQLRVYASRDCGQTWELRRSLGGSMLSTISSLQSAPFTPAANEWKTMSLSFDFYRDKGPILIKFEFYSGGGNNIYLDNISFRSLNIGLEEDQLNEALSVYPNPTNGDFVVDFGMELDQDMEISILDLSGRNVATVAANKGSREYEFNTGKFAPGVYLIQLTGSDQQLTRKLIVQ